jgi:hypothetical protein
MPLGLAPRLAGLAPILFRGVVATILGEFNWRESLPENCCATGSLAGARGAEFGALARGHSVARNDVPCRSLRFPSLCRCVRPPRAGNPRGESASRAISSDLREHKQLAFAAQMRIGSRRFREVAGELMRISIFCRLNHCQKKSMTRN